MPIVLTRLADWTNARRRFVWLWLFLLVLVVLLIVLTPVFLIMPFKAQTPWTMEISYLLRRWSPLLTLVASLLILVLSIGLWLLGRWWRRLVLAILLVPTFAATWLARQNRPIIDTVAAVPIVLVVGEDKRSVRAFERIVDGRRLEFFQKSENQNEGFRLIDAETASTWNFEGKAIAGPLAGRQLKKLFVLEDYWFDWRIYHPNTEIYAIGPQ